MGSLLLLACSKACEPGGHTDEEMESCRGGKPLGFLTRAQLHAVFCNTKCWPLIVQVPQDSLVRRVFMLPLPSKGFWGPKKGRALLRSHRQLEEKPELNPSSPADCFSQNNSISSSPYGEYQADMPTLACRSRGTHPLFLLSIFCGLASPLFPSKEFSFLPEPCLQLGVTPEKPGTDTLTYPEVQVTCIGSSQAAGG